MPRTSPNDQLHLQSGDQVPPEELLRLFAGAEKVDDLTVRVKTRGPYPMLMARMIGVLPIPRTASGARRGLFSWAGRRSGSRVPTVVKFNESTGIEMERWDLLQVSLGPAPAFAHRLRRCPTPVTQIAEMMIGNIDVKDGYRIRWRRSPPIRASSRRRSPDMNFQYYGLRRGRPISGLSVQGRTGARGGFHAVDRDAIRSRSWRWRR